MVHVIVDPSDSNRVLHVEPKLRPRTAAEVSAGHLILEWPEDFTEIHIGGTVTITRNQISAHARHDIAAAELAEKLARARAQVRDILYWAIPRLLDDENLQVWVPGKRGHPLTARNLARVQLQVFTTYAYRHCDNSQTDGDAALTAANNYRLAIMPSEINFGGIMSFAWDVAGQASLRTAWGRVHAARNLVVYTEGAAADIVIESGVSTDNWNKFGSARQFICEGNWIGL